MDDNSASSDTDCLQSHLRRPPPAQKINSDESMWCNQGSPRPDDDDDISKRMPIERKGRLKLLQKLPSPRELRSPESPIPPAPLKQLVSISELDPFFEELDVSSSSEGSSTDTDIQTSAPEKKQGDSTVPREKGKSSISLIKWSSLGSSSLPGLPTAAKSQDSSGSSSGSGRDNSSKKGKDGESKRRSSSDDRSSKERNSLKSKLKSVSHSVKKRLSVTGGFFVEKLTKQRGAKSESSVEETDNNGEISEGKKEKDKEQVSRSPKFSSQESLHDDDGDECVTDLSQKNPNYQLESGMELESPVPVLHPHRISHDDKIDHYLAGFILNLPNGTVDNPLPSERQINHLPEEIEEEKHRISQLKPMDWANSVDFLGRSVGRDFRKGYLALGEKMQLPNLQSVRCLKFSSFHSFLAIGCEEGTLILLELDFQKPLHTLSSQESLQNLLYHVPLGSRCRIQMNETLVGHAFDLRCISWNCANGILLTSDEIGVIIGWGFGESACWSEEFINDKSTSMIKDMAWSPNGKKIAICYEDYAHDGSFTGGIIVGYVDGTHIFGRKFPESHVNFVTWFDDYVVWAVVNYTVYSFDEKGEVGKTCRSLMLNGQSSEITAFLIKPRSSWINSENAPDYAVIYRDSCMSLYHESGDQASIRIHTQVIATCADWSPNGVYIVVGGITDVSGDASYPRINLYNYEGKLLQILKIPEQTITSVSWNHDSLHLGVAAARQIYFASLRPMYKVSSNKNSVHCYAYTKDCVNQLISFWNEKTLLTERIPGKIIDIKNFGDKFAVLFMDNVGVYHVVVFSETAVHQQHLCILTLEPFSITMTKTSIICLASNAILNWNYNLKSSSGGGSKLTGALKETRQVHVDDFPGIIPKPGERGDHLLRPVMDCARCLHALGDRLCVARESGKMQLYALPTLGFLQTYLIDLEGDIVQQVSFNKDGSQLALLSMNGKLRICIFPQESAQFLEVIYCEMLSSVSGIQWASDVGNLICAMESNNLHIVHDGQVVETISNIPSGCYLTNFESLNISLINMEKVIESPDRPSPVDFLIKVVTPTLTKIREAILHDDELMEDIVDMLKTSYSHSTLRKMVADEALVQGEYDIAEGVYFSDKNYPAVQFMKTLDEMDNLEVQKAEIHCFLGDYDQGQNYFLRAGRKDLVIKMWKELGDWENVNFLTGYSSEDLADEALENMFDEFVGKSEWMSALEVCNKLGNAEGLMECCVILGDYEKLLALSEKLPAKDPLLKRIGEFLASVGGIEGAVQCFVAYGDTEAAMTLTMENHQWDLAMRLSNEHNLPLTRPTLVNHVKSLIGKNNLGGAIQILERCGKTITAGKLLVWKALCKLQTHSAKPMEVKKMFVLAAKMLSKKNTSRSRVKRHAQKKLFTDEYEELDLEFLIPEEHLKVMSLHNEWCWSDPWRGAEAAHFLCLAQRFLYNGMMGRAMKAAMHLRKYEDILGLERVNTLITLAAINNNYQEVASNALLKLESLDEGYTSISLALFENHAPENEGVIRIQCPSCTKYIPDFFSVCPICNISFPMCVFSSSPIFNENDLWTCKTCLRHVELGKCDRFEYCPLCHSLKR